MITLVPKSLDMKEYNQLSQVNEGNWAPISITNFKMNLWSLPNLKSQAHLQIRDRWQHHQKVVQALQSILFKKGNRWRKSISFRYQKAVKNLEQSK